MMRFEVTTRATGEYAWNLYTESGSYYARSAQSYVTEAGVIRSLRKQFGKQGHTLTRLNGDWNYL